MTYTLDELADQTHKGSLVDQLRDALASTPLHQIGPEIRRRRSDLDDQRASLANHRDTLQQQVDTTNAERRRLIAEAIAAGRNAPQFKPADTHAAELAAIDDQLAALASIGKAYATLEREQIAAEEAHVRSCVAAIDAELIERHQKRSRDVFRGLVELLAPCRIPRRIFFDIVRQVMNEVGNSSRPERADRVVRIADLLNEFRANPRDFRDYFPNGVHIPDLDIGKAIDAVTDPVG